MSDINIFQERTVSPYIKQQISAGAPQPQTLTPADASFYLYALIQGSLPAAVDDRSLPASVTAPMHLVDASGSTAEVLEELAFLEALGLASAPRPGTTSWLVAPEVTALYAMFTGLMARPPVGARAPIMKPVVDLFRKAILPGRLWRAYGARRDLADNIYEAVALDRHIRDIQTAQAELVGIFP
jgi:hypothetical protein